MKQFLISVLLGTWLTACGSAYDRDSESYSALLDEVKIAFIHNANGSGSFALSSPTPLSSIELCELQTSGNCVAIPNIQFVATQTSQGSRRIYATRNPVFFRVTTSYSLRSQGRMLRNFYFDRSGSDRGRGPWKMILMTGDNEFNAWDNAREKLYSMFTDKGVPSQNILQLTMKRNKEVPRKILASSRQNLKVALQNLNPNGEDKCFVFMTSHGSRRGFFLRNKGTITPDQFDQILTDTCGDRPTVALVSACYSGVMITQRSKKPNRIILTAASSSKTSFGCDARSTYTFFDQCVIESIPKAKTWKNFSEINRQCVYALERQRRMPHHSDPQIWIGAEVKDLEMP